MDRKHLIVGDFCIGRGIAWLSSHLAIIEAQESYRVPRSIQRRRQHFALVAVRRFWDKIRHRWDTYALCALDDRSHHPHQLYTRLPHVAGTRSFITTDQPVIKQSPLGIGLQSIAASIRLADEIDRQLQVRLQAGDA